MPSLGRRGPSECSQVAERQRGAATSAWAIEHAHQDDVQEEAFRHALLLGQIRVPT